MAQLLLASSSLAAAAPACLADALARVEACLDGWAGNSAAYNPLLLQVFGAAGTEPALWQQAAAALQSTLQASGLAIGLELLTNDELPGINGAYTAQAPGGGERIYLNSAWLQSASAEQIEAVLLEELGHAIDSRLNGSADSPGDEGERFSALLRGLQPTAASFNENDQRQIVVAGVTVAVEADTTRPVAVTTAPAFAQATSNPFGLLDVGAFASPSFVDIDGDGDLDAFIGESRGNTFFFRNTAAAGAGAPAFTAETTSFGLADVGYEASPNFVDIDGDGDLDAFIGNIAGNTLFFRNSAAPGSSNPAFVEATTNPFGLTDVGSRGILSFVDIDGDGDFDVFVGNLDGNTVFFRNTATPGSTDPAFAPPVTNTFGLTDVGGSAAPSFVDIDGDGDLDALFGRLSGDTQFFRNTAEAGAANPAFAAGNTNPFNLTDSGSITRPALVDIDGDGDLDAFIGSFNGNTVFFRNTAPVLDIRSVTPDGTYGTGAVITLTVRFSEAVIVNTTGGSPTLALETGSTDRLASFSGGSGTDTLIFTYTVQAGDTSADLDVRSADALALNGGTIRDAAGNDAILTLAVRSATGSLASNAALVVNTTPPVAITTAPAFAAPITNPFGLTKTFGFTDPSFVDIDRDGDFDVFISERFGNTFFFRNTAGLGSTDPAFAPGSTNPFGLTDVGDSATASFADIDGDGDLDAFVGNYQGNSLFFRNTAEQGATAASFANPSINPFGLTDVGRFASPSFVDIDGDGDFDAFIGEISGNISFFKNSAATGASDAAFAAPSINPFGLTKVSVVASTDFVDIDGDGTIDAFISDGYGNTFFFRNTGSATAPAFAAAATNPFGFADVGGSAKPSLIDIDGDGDLDAFIGNGYGDTVFFRNTAPQLGVNSFTVNGIYGTGSVITLSVHFSETVIVNTTGGSPTLALETGSNDRLAVFIGGSGTDTLIFSYTVQPGDKAADLDLTSSSALVLNGATIRDADGNDAILTLPVPGTRGSLGANAALVIDGIAPRGALRFEPAFAAASTNPFGLSDVGDQAVPGFADSDGDGDLDLFIGNKDGNTLFFRNTAPTGGTAFAFAAASLNPFGIPPAASFSISPSLIDSDRDGDLDLFIGNKQGNTQFFLNTAPPLATAPAFAAPSTNPFGLTDAGSFISPTFADIDGDGDLDAFIGNYDGNILFFNNTAAAGATAPAFAAPSTNPFGISDAGFRAKPAFGDSDGDGDLDLFVGNSSGNLLFFRNTAAAGATDPAFAAPSLNPFGITTVGTLAAPVLVDSDADGDLDLFIGNNDGNLLFFRNTASTPVAPVAATIPDGTYTIGALITLTLRFSEAVIVDTTGGTPTLALETGAVDRFASFTGGSGTDTLTFSYTVQAGDSSADLDQLSANALTLNGGSIKDAAGNDAILTLAAPGAAGSLGATAALVIDGIAPLLTAGPTLTGSSGISITANESGTAALFKADNSQLFPTALTANTAATLTLEAQATITTATLKVADTAGNLTAAIPSFLLGTAANDSITGSAAADFLYGFAGSDILTGGAGIDTLIGGDGNDFYNIETNDDLVVETNAIAATGGIDTIRSSVASTTLADNVETLILTGSGAINGTGNALNNRLTGNAASNILTGGAGIDTLIGGDGNDFYNIETSGDLVVENNDNPFTSGSDTVRSSLAAYTLAANVETLILTGSGAINGTGNALNNRLTGNGAANMLMGAGGSDGISGGAGNDTLIGGDGNDTLTGEGGADTFRFRSPLNGATNRDLITDFTLAQADTIELENAVFTALPTTGALAASAFFSGAAATSAAHRILYNSATGLLAYDADGNGASAAIAFATLTPGLALTSSQFTVT